MSGLGMPKPKRVGPPDVQPLTREGVRYEAIHWGRERGLGQNGGFIAAFDVASGKELWMARVYAIEYIDKLETDVQDIFIRTIEPAANGGGLQVTDERGRRFLFDIANRTASPLE